MSKPKLETIKPTTSFCGFCLVTFNKGDTCLTHPKSGMSLHLMCARVLVEAVRQHDERVEAGKPVFPGEILLGLQKSPTVLGSETAADVGSASKES